VRNFSNGSAVLTVLWLLTAFLREGKLRDVLGVKSDAVRF
jgi:hypothetical protein